MSQLEFFFVYGVVTTLEVRQTVTQKSFNSGNHLTSYQLGPSKNSRVLFKTNFQEDDLWKGHLEAFGSFTLESGEGRNRGPGG